MNVTLSWYQYTEHPDSDSCWSLSTGPDGRIYASACCELTPGGFVKLVRYNEATDSLEYLLDLDQVIEDPHDSGRATQCKVHYSFVPSMRDGVLYMATHLSGAPFDRPAYQPWYEWHDEKRCFRGSALIAFDTKTDRVLWWDTLLPKEGSRCLVFDEERGKFYAVSYPRDHFVEYDLATRQRRDIGRIGSINSQVLFLDKSHRVWTTRDDGRLVRFDPAKDRIEISPDVLPHNTKYQTGWHSVFYDAVAAPDGESIFAITWIADPYLVRIWPNEGEWGRVENLGPVAQPRNLHQPMDTFIDHAGGLVVGGDGMIYYVVARWHDPVYHPTPNARKAHEGVVFRLDPNTLHREEAFLVERPDQYAHYVSRAAIDRNGDLFFGHVGPKPVGIIKAEMPAGCKRPNAHLPIRVWG